jgi:hypothetical protein
MEDGMKGEKGGQINVPEREGKGEKESKNEMTRGEKKIIVA